ncbi:MAG: helix-turn-helix domain-containing protein [Deferribacteraceae bacterium]|jgi:transcriptional regulator with XRE-family HTH domain|nr:helix-turn-helix domain-containing protein [Deferribacteraceae bacterium]
MDRNNLIRERINSAIRQSNLSRLKVTELAEISYPNLTRFLNGKRSCSIGIDILIKLSEVLGVPLGYLFGEDERDYLADKDLDIIVKRISKLPENKRNKIKEAVNSILDIL